MNIVMKLSSPIVYRRLFVAGLLVFGIGAFLVNVYVIFFSILLLILSKYGMRKEHKEKSKL